jgi:hypothetical protein
VRDHPAAADLLSLYLRLFQLLAGTDSLDTALAHARAATAAVHGAILRGKPTGSGRHSAGRVHLGLRCAKT